MTATLPGPTSQSAWRLPLRRDFSSVWIAGCTRIVRAYGRRYLSWSRRRGDDPGHLACGPYARHAGVDGQARYDAASIGLSGIGFIGGGAILRRGDLVLGVTSAATIWLMTVIGLCFGGGQLGLGAIALATLWLMQYVEAAIVTGRHGTIAVTVSTAGSHEPVLFTLLAERGFKLRSRGMELTPDAATRVTFSGRYKGAYPDWSSGLVRVLAAIPGVSRVEWRDID
jgi:MgtC family